MKSVKFPIKYDIVRIIKEGKMDLGQVFTNKLVAEYMTSLFSLKKSACMLDPCFGNGIEESIRVIEFSAL